MSLASLPPCRLAPFHRAPPLSVLLLLLGLIAPVAAATAEPPPVPAEELAERRQAVMEAIGPDAVLVMLAPEAPPRNGDVSWPFRQDDDLYWLTGVAEPESALVLMPGEERYRQVLFARDRDPLSEKWDGPIPEHETLAEVSGIEEVHSAGGALDLVEAALAGWHWGESDLYRYFRTPVAPRVLDAVRRGDAELWLDLGKMGGSTGLRRGATTPEQRLADRVREAFPGVTVRSATRLLADLREIKSPAEVAILEHAIDLTEAGIRAGMARALTAERENQVQASVEHAFRDLGACCWGFPSIVAAGANTTILHYPPAEAPVPRDALVLLDVGADYAGYTADITRTFPADGTFSPEQREIYQAVLDTWNTLRPRMRPGVLMADLHNQAVELLGEELLELGLVTENTPEQVTWHYPHGLGHPLGLQVHDSFDRTRTFEPGMVWTLEPGIYVRPADVEASPAFEALPPEERAALREALGRYGGIGVRIEDDLLITDGAPRVLSDGTPREIDEIEALMAEMAAAGE